MDASDSRIQPKKRLKLEESPVDHYIQAQILQQLFKQSTPIPFNELKPDDIQNSLFMYHMRKLETRGLVARTDDGFTLTASGVRWVNYVSPNKLSPRLTPRVLVKFLLFNHDKTKVLISRRKSAAADYMGQYLLPSGFQKYGLSFAASAALQVISLTGQSPTLTPLGIHESIYESDDGYVHHVVGSLFEGTLEEMTLPADEHYELLWVAVGDVENYDTTIAAQLRWYLEGKSFSGETFTFTSK